MHIPFTKEKDGNLAKAILAAVILLAVFLLAETIQTIKETSVLGQGDYPETSITFTGTGEVSAIPDVATFNFTVTKEAKTVEEAQRLVEVVVSKATELLEDEDIEDKDIKTQRYNIQPQYDWVKSTDFGNSERVFKGYEASQYTVVKVRDIDNSGDLLGKIGALGITNIGSLSFEVDDTDNLKRDARKMAIEDAQEKAEQLAKDLNVKIVRIVGFHENEGGFYPQPYLARSESLGIGGDTAVKSPTISKGEETITSNVSITYEIR
jgi:uncharacterized protein